MATSSGASTGTYLHNGQVLRSPPLTARLARFGEDTVRFVGLYVTTLLSLDAHAAAEQSSFATRDGLGNLNDNNGGGGGGGGSGGGGGGGPGGKPLGRRLGTVDQVRGPECKSCG